MTETEYPDIFLLATAGRDRLIQVFEISKEIKLIQTLDDHSSSVNSLTFAFQGTYLISSSTDKTIRFRKFNKVPLLKFFLIFFFFSSFSDFYFIFLGIKFI